MVDGPTFNEGEHYHRKIYEPNKLNGSGKNQDGAPEPDPRAFARKRFERVGKPNLSNRAHDGKDSRNNRGGCAPRY
jgi:hypothetical protein